MRAVLSGADKVLTLIPESYDDGVQLKAFFTAAGSLTTVAVTQGADTGRAGHAVASVPTFWKSTILTLS